jgi:hypothetical protein
MKNERVASAVSVPSFHIQDDKPLLQRQVCDCASFELVFFGRIKVFHPLNAPFWHLLQNRMHQYRLNALFWCATG